MKNLAINFHRWNQYDTWSKLVSAFNHIIKKEKNSIQCYVHDGWDKLASYPSVTIDNFIVSKKEVGSYSRFCAIANIPSAEWRPPSSDFLEQRIKLEYSLRKNKDQIFSPIFVIGIDSNNRLLETLRDSWKYNIFFISLFDFEDGPVNIKPDDTIFKDQENFEFLDVSSPYIENLFNHLINLKWNSNCLNHNLVLPKTEIILNESGDKEFAKQSLVKGSAKLSISDLIFGMETHKLTHQSPEVIEVAGITQSCYESTLILKNKEELIHLMNK